MINTGKRSTLKGKYIYSWRSEFYQSWNQGTQATWAVSTVWVAGELHPPRGKILFQKQGILNPPQFFVQEQPYIKVGRNSSGIHL